MYTSDCFGVGRNTLSERSIVSSAATRRHKHKKQRRACILSKWICVDLGGSYLNHHHHHQFMKPRVRKKKNRLATGKRWMEVEACMVQKTIKKLNDRVNRMSIARQHVRLDCKEKKEVTPELSEEFKAMQKSIMALASNLINSIKKMSEAEGMDPMDALMDANTDVEDSDSDEEEEKEEGGNDHEEQSQYQMLEYPTESP